MPEPYCELCDLPLAFCVHGHVHPEPEPPARPTSTRRRAAASPDPRSTPAIASDTHGTTHPAGPTHVRVEVSAPRPQATIIPGFLEVSPSLVAHFPGCPDKGDELDFSQWGLITRSAAEAWQELGRRIAVPCDAGHADELVARERCTTCDAHGAWV